MGHGADVPDVGEDGAGVVDEESGKLTVIIPGTDDGVFVDAPSGCVVEKRFGIEHRILGGDVGLRAVEADVTLALLLGIVEGVGVKERPDELAADIFEAEFEMGMLVDGVMAAVERGGADVEALLIGDFFGHDEARGVAGARGGDGGVVGMREGVAEGDAGGGGFDEFAGTARVEHAGLRGHVGKQLYTGGRMERVESRKLKVEGRAEMRPGFDGGIWGGCKRKSNAEAELKERAEEESESGKQLREAKSSLIMGEASLIMGET